MLTIDTVKELVAQSDQAARKAAESVRPAHQKALEAATQLRDELATNTSEPERRRRLVEIIEKSTAKRKTSPEAASAVLQQYIANVTASREINATRQRDGVFWISTVHHYTSDWPIEMRQKVIDALVMGCAGKIDAGLMTFPKSIADAVDRPTAEALANIADPEALKKYQRNQEKLALEFAEAQRYLDAVSGAEPQLYVVEVEDSEQATIAVRNNRPGSSMVARIQFEGGTITELTPEQFDRVRDNQFFTARIESGEFEIVTTAAQVAAA